MNRRSVSIVRKLSLRQALERLKVTVSPNPVLLGRMSIVDVETKSSADVPLDPTDLFFGITVAAAVRHDKRC